jgi:hypothetical protein
MYLFCISTLISNTTFCGSDTYAELPLFLKQACRAGNDQEECDKIMTLMSPYFIRKVEGAWDKTAWFSYKDSCNDVDHTPEVKKACRVINDAYERAVKVEKSVRELGKKHSVNETAVDFAVAHCHNKVMAKEYRPNKNYYQSKQSDKKSDSPDIEQCLGCNIDKKLSWWPWGKKKS